MSAERKKLLDDLGLERRVYRTFEDRIAELKAWKADHGYVSAIINVRSWN